MLATKPVPRILLQRAAFVAPVIAWTSVRLTGELLRDRTGRLLRWEAQYDADGVPRTCEAVVVLDCPGGSRRAVSVGADDIEAIEVQP